MAVAKEISAYIMYHTFQGVKSSLCNRKTQPLGHKEMDATATY